MSDPLREGIRLYRAKRWELCLAELLKAEVPPEDTEGQGELAYYLGLCYAKLERYDDSLLYLEQVVTTQADLMRVYQCRMTLAYVYAITSRSRLAEFELKQLLEQGFESVQIYATLAYAAWKQKRVDQCLDWYRKALEVDAESPTALNGLGYVLADSDTDVRKGLVYCRKAVDRKPQNAAYLDSLGWAHFKNGDLPEARTWLRRALDLAPREKEIVGHMRVILGEATE